MINALLGSKQEMTQRFTQDGHRIPVTQIVAGPCPVVQVKTAEGDGYTSIQLGWGEKKIKRTTKPIQGHIKGAKLKKAPRFLKEVRLETEKDTEAHGLNVGDVVKVGDVFAPGDIVNVTGTSKGKGFTGVMKRWGFAGGPATHGQSDRQRAPGSIGQTNVGRVWPGKKMAGRAGGDRVTMRNLTVMAVDPEANLLLVKGLVPGAKGGLLVIKKTGKGKRFVPLLAKGEKKIIETEEEKKQRLAREAAAAEKLKEAEEKEEAERVEAKPEKKVEQVEQVEPLDSTRGKQEAEEGNAQG